MMQHQSPYLAMSDNPVSFIDPNGGFDEYAFAFFESLTDDAKSWSQFAYANMLDINAVMQNLIFGGGDDYNEEAGPGRRRRQQREAEKRAGFAFDEFTTTPLWGMDILSHTSKKDKKKQKESDGSRWGNVKREEAAERKAQAKAQREEAERLRAENERFQKPKGLGTPGSITSIAGIMTGGLKDVSEYDGNNTRFKYGTNVPRQSAQQLTNSYKAFATRAAGALKYAAGTFGVVSAIDHGLKMVQSYNPNQSFIQNILYNPSFRNNTIKTGLDVGLVVLNFVKVTNPAASLILSGGSFIYGITESLW